ncbi:hypothetical protein FNN08_14380 [Thalassomonas sp. M1454]|nr:hypothetical protein FNN08_14380 [Thalassomonas sp. M1454]
MNGRIYDPNLGRFMSVDPFIQNPTNTQSINAYSYIMNNPVNGTDPSGYIGEDDHKPYTGAFDGSDGIGSGFNPFGNSSDSSNDSDNGSSIPFEQTIEGINGKWMSENSSLGLNVDVISLSFSINTANWINSIMEDKAYKNSLMGDTTSWAAGGGASSNAKSKQGFIRGVADFIGKIWNLPNTIIGLAWGFTGHIVTEIGQFFGLTNLESEIGFGNNAIEFTSNLFGGSGAIALGNTITWGVEKGGTFYTKMSSHEELHTVQGQFLGFTYIPLNLLGMGSSFIGTTFFNANLRTQYGGKGKFHGEPNFMEGPIFKDELYD